MQFMAAFRRSLGLVKAFSRARMPFPSVTRSIFTTPNPSIFSSRSVFRPQLNVGEANSTFYSLMYMQVRGFKNPKSKMKTRKCAKKRFIPTGTGKLKRNHAGKCHLTGHMSRKRKMRLNSKVFLSGTNLKRMKKLIT
mmetsp:Transcript_6064/g.9160  ORF Transcript_6064/g.9160 Transcript_6064/m.9160 type:complete len:137 (+) Transcript_6064:56-466(+)